jgi:uncharacterized protein (DUF488 family)
MLVRCQRSSARAANVHCVDQALTIWTIGHSNHDFHAFARLLGAERIDFVVDVRSFPYSQFVPHFNREEIDVALRKAGFGYLFLGEALGGRPSRPEHYDCDGHALYGLMAEELDFGRAATRLVDGASRRRIALMCSEGMPEACHRRLLVGKVLAERGLALRHILPNGAVVEEKRVAIERDNDQPALFDERVPVWRSTQSVSHRRRPSASSAA